MSMASEQPLVIMSAVRHPVALTLEWPLAGYSVKRSTVKQTVFDFVCWVIAVGGKTDALKANCSKPLCIFPNCFFFSKCKVFFFIDVAASMFLAYLFWQSFSPIVFCFVLWKLPICGASRGGCVAAGIDYSRLQPVPRLELYVLVLGDFLSDRLKQLSLSRLS